MQRKELVTALSAPSGERSTVQPDLQGGLGEIDPLGFEKKLSIDAPDFPSHSAGILLRSDGQLHYPRGRMTEKR
jgi:hypothetical protein